MTTYPASLRRSKKAWNFWKEFSMLPRTPSSSKIMLVTDCAWRTSDREIFRLLNLAFSISSYVGKKKKKEISFIFSLKDPKISNLTSVCLNSSIMKRNIWNNWCNKMQSLLYHTFSGHSFMSSMQICLSTAAVLCYHRYTCKCSKPLVQHCL